MALEKMMKDDLQRMAWDAYTADCLGLIARSMYQSKDLPLYTEMIETADRPVETAEDVKKKILRLLQ